MVLWDYNWITQLQLSPPIASRTTMVSYSSAVWQKVFLNNSKKSESTME